MTSYQLSVIDIPEHCGNAPRKMVIRDFLIALYSRDIDEVTATLQDDIRWEIVGRKTLRRVAEVRDWLLTATPVKALTLQTVITHGTDCGVDGSLTYVDGSTEQFNHIILFSGHGKTSKIKEIRSYVINH